MCQVAPATATLVSVYTHCLFVCVICRLPPFKDGDVLIYLNGRLIDGKSWAVTSFFLSLFLLRHLHRAGECVISFSPFRRTLWCKVRAEVLSAVNCGELFRNRSVSYFWATFFCCFCAASLFLLFPCTADVIGVRDAFLLPTSPEVKQAHTQRHSTDMYRWRCVNLINALLLKRGEKGCCWCYFCCCPLSSLKGDQYIVGRMMMMIMTKTTETVVICPNQLPQLLGDWSERKRRSVSKSAKVRKLLSVLCYLQPLWHWHNARTCSKGISLKQIFIRRTNGN